MREIIIIIINKHLHSPFLWVGLSVSYNWHLSNHDDKSTGKTPIRTHGGQCTNLPSLDDGPLIFHPSDQTHRPHWNSLGAPHLERDKEQLCFSILRSTIRRWHSLASLQQTNILNPTSSNICRLYVLSSSAKYTTPCWPSAPGWALRSSRSHRRPSFLCSTPRGFSQLGSPWGERRKWWWMNLNLNSLGGK